MYAHEDTKTGKIICSTLCSLLFVVNVYGAPEGHDYARNAPKLSDKVKFGLGSSLVFGPKSSVAVDSNHLISVDVFGYFFDEHKINSRIGVRLSFQRAELVVVMTEMEDSTTI